MYDTLWQLIQSGSYTLEDITYKINVLWIQGQLTEDEKNELLALSMEQLDPEQERPETLEMLRALSARVTALEGRVDALEGSAADSDTYPAWTVWDGMSDNYQYGAIVSHNGKLWISTLQTQNTWEPGSDVSNQMGLWVEYTPDGVED